MYFSSFLQCFYVTSRMTAFSFQQKTWSQYYTEFTDKKTNLQKIHYKTQANHTHIGHFQFSCIDSIDQIMWM